LNFEYAERIASEWNSADARHGYVGFVTRFAVPADFIGAYEPHQVGDHTHLEYWIPAEELPRFDAASDGPIETVAEYRNGRVR
jgi:hypothetical protein